MNFLDTLQGSLLEGFYPAGWDLAKIDACCANPPASVTARQSAPTILRSSRNKTFCKPSKPLQAC